MARKKRGMQEWVAKMIAIHGDTYDYSLCVSDDQIIDGNRTKIPIICRTHGVFPQSIGNHLKGQHCPDCRTHKKIPIEQHLKDVIKKHGDRYKYPKWKTGYLLVDGAKTKMPVTCKKHGVFYVSISDHKAGAGCLDCAGLRPLTMAVCLANVKEVHGDEYDYSLWVSDDQLVKGRNTKLPVICHTHGIFHISYSGHASGSGCKQCGTARMKEHHTTTLATHLKTFEEVHGNRYGYSHLTPDMITKGTKTKVDIMCYEKGHGMFPQSIYLHSTGSGCPKCAGRIKLTMSEWLQRALEIHGNTYDYKDWKSDDQLVDGADTKMLIGCAKHGTFPQTINCHTYAKQGCPKCANERIGKNSRATLAYYLPKFAEKHGNTYDYSDITEDDMYAGGGSLLPIKCSKHGVFGLKAVAHSQGVGCAKCGVEKNTRRQTKDAAYYMDRIAVVHGDTYIYPKITDDMLVDGIKTKIDIVCCKHGSFTQAIDNHIAGQGCSKCVGSVSKVETRLYDALCKAFPDVTIEQSKRGVITSDPLKEIDIWFPDYKIGIEVNGHYWHSVTQCAKSGKDKRHIFTKTQNCIKDGIRLYHFDDLDTDQKVYIIVSMITSKLGRLPTRIFARKCIVKPITSTEANAFYEVNHLQGKARIQSALGLFNDGVLVAAMAFGLLRSGRTYLTRFASLLHTSVVGGFSKLLKQYRREHVGQELYSIADLRYGYGDVYRNAGWERTGLTDRASVSYDYYYNGDKYNKSWGMKSKLVDRFLECATLVEANPNATESMLADVAPIYCVYDAGKRTYKIVC